MKIGIYVDKDHGYMDYNEYTQQVMVTNKVDKIRWAVYRYLTTEHSFRLPLGEEEGCFQDLVIVPTQSSQYIQLALCQMYSSIGVHVDWKNKNNKYKKPKKEGVQSSSVNDDNNYNVFS